MQPLSSTASVRAPGPDAFPTTPHSFPPLHSLSECLLMLPNTGDTKMNKTKCLTLSPESVEEESNYML